MPFPVPETFEISTKTQRRDDEKRELSPPSFLLVNLRSINVTARYLDDKIQDGYAGTKKNHVRTINAALLAQMLAAFEWCIKDYVAKIVTTTDAFDGDLIKQAWIKPRTESVLAARSEGGTIGAGLIHPIVGWHNIKKTNEFFRVLFGDKLVSDPQDEEKLSTLWMIRHSLAHNAGIVTHPDAYRMKEPSLSGRLVDIDRDFLEQTREFLVSIAVRLESPIGDSMLSRWYTESATQVYSDDKETFRRLKLIATAVTKRSEALPRILKGRYTKQFSP